LRSDSDFNKEATYLLSTYKIKILIMKFTKPAANSIFFADKIFQVASHYS